MRYLVAVLCALCLTVHSGKAAKAAAAQWQQEFEHARKWSELGVVDDGRSDNSDALNALPAGTPIKGDCPGGGVIRFNARWFLKSDLKLWVQPGCWLEAYADNFGAITQSDPGKPINNVRIYGLNLRHGNQPVSQRAFWVFANNFTLSNFTIDRFNAFGFFRGSCQEFSYGSVTNAAQVVGRPGLRHWGNIPKVSCPSQPADVWVHHNKIEAGDAAYQVAPSASAKFPWSDTSADDYLFENNTGISYGADFFLIAIGTPKQTLPMKATVSNIVLRNSSGSGYSHGIRIQNAQSTGAVSKIKIDGVKVDLARADRGITAGLFVRGYQGFPVDGVSVNNLTVLNPYLRGFDIGGNAVSNVSISKSTFNQPRVAGAGNGTIRGTTNTRVVNSTIVARNRAGIEVGPLSAGAYVDITAPAKDVVITGNTISSVANSQSAIISSNVSQANYSNNTIRVTASPSGGADMPLRRHPGTQPQPELR